MHAMFRPNFIFRRTALEHGPIPPPAIEPASESDAIHLKKHQHLHLHRACGWTVRALSGTIWITQDGDIRDIVLEDGQSFILDRNRTAVLSAFNDAKFLLWRGPCRQPVLRQVSPPRPLPAFGAIRALRA
jgi:hypothetical protein